MVETFRGKEGKKFSNLVDDHIENYTVPQYGDFPSDQMASASIGDIKHNMLRYINRLGKNMRGHEEQLRDMLKLAHYACIAHKKLDIEYQIEHETYGVLTNEGVELV